MMKKSGSQSGKSPAELIDARIEELGDWRGEMLGRLRALIQAADPEVVEEWKWNVPVWSHDGIISTGETYKKAVKLTFARGASLPDPAGLFNSSLEGNTRRAIDIHEGEQVHGRTFKALVKAAVAENLRPSRPKASARKSKSTPQAGAKAKQSASQAKPAKVKLLSGGNPQIAKADGDRPVEAYITAMPGWKREVGRRLDALIVRAVPNVSKAVKWNTPFYGV